jgi:hypothetical protein
MLKAQWHQELMHEMPLIQPSLRDGGNTRLLFPALKRRAIVGMSLRDNNRPQTRWHFERRLRPAGKCMDAHLNSYDS